MLGVDLTPALVILGVAFALSVAVRVALGLGAARARRRGAAIVASVPRASAGDTAAPDGSPAGADSLAAHAAEDAGERGPEDATERADEDDPDAGA